MSLKLKMLRHRGLVATAVLATTTIGLAGITTGGAAYGSSARASALTLTQQINKIVKGAESPGTWTGPKTSPSPKKGKRIFVLASTEASIGNQEWIKYIKMAAKTMGWKVTAYDGQATVSDYALGLEAAITGRYSGVILLAITPALVSTQVAAVRAAGIPIVDISDTQTPSPTTVNYNIGYNPAKESQGMAAFVAKNSGGTAQVAILSDSEYGVVVTRMNSFESNLAKLCPGCKIVVTSAVQGAEVDTPGLVTQIEGVLQANPTVNYLWSPYDDLIASITPAIAAVGDTNTVKVVTYNGFPQVLAGIRSGTAPVVADIGSPGPWMAYEAMDTLNRIFAKDTKTITNQVTHSDPYRLFSASSLPSVADTQAAGWVGDYNFVKKYTQLWKAS